MPNEVCPPPPPPVVPVALNQPEGDRRWRHCRRLVAKIMAKEVAKKGEWGTAPFCYALFTKAG